MVADQILADLEAVGYRIVHPHDIEGHKVIFGGTKPDDYVEAWHDGFDAALLAINPNGMTSAELRARYRPGSSSLPSTEPVTARNTPRQADDTPKTPEGTQDYNAHPDDCPGWICTHCGPRWRWHHAMDCGPDDAEPCPICTPWPPPNPETKPGWAFSSVQEWLDQLPAPAPGTDTPTVRPPAGPHESYSKETWRLGHPLDPYSAADWPYWSPMKEPVMTARRNRITIYQARDGHRWRLRATNGRIVAESGEAYSTRNKAARAAHALAGFTADAVIVFDDKEPIR
jgi:uncharacterized protein YegP (UPF0339 family)